ncbi:hypothetical protein [Kineosporia sp. NBRC 101731]|uniref:hypothetical protein n=1 Tax=Kineosporia sp. NBRC 101731 TaxID=3032199 RepID=UPI0024A21C24|nr:hypothetical protein [Kineosporia sp. NBRC 101731]GLY29822.1 hypothetical protein Kisp02_31870 [Kineosporia sp. NBRC 101731]
MFAFFSRRLRTWLLLTVAVPALAVAARAVAHRIEKRNGPTTVSRALISASNFIGRRSEKSQDLAAGGQAEANRSRFSHRRH